MKLKSTFSRSQCLTICLGNLFEHYDTALFGFLSPFLAPLFFPSHDPLSALILTYAMISLGMLARPIGSLFFGYMGDLYGRREALFLSLSGMSLISFGIAIIPTYQHIGFLAPLFFCLARIIQNFLSSGESMGGAILLLENAPEEKHDLLSSIYNVSTIGGILLASGGVSLLCCSKSVEFGWRFLYLFGCLTALFGCLLRKNIHLNHPISSKPKPSPKNLRTILWEYRRQLLLIALCSGLSYANYSISLVVINGFIPLVSSLTKEQMSGMNTLLLIIDFASLPAFGWLSSKISREKLMTGIALTITLSAIPLFSLLENATFATIIAIRIALVLLGVAFSAPFHAWAQQVIPAVHRYLIISFGYAIGTQLFGGPSAAISLWLYKHTGIPSSISWYWMALALANCIALRGALKPREKDLVQY